MRLKVSPRVNEHEIVVLNKASTAGTPTDAWDDQSVPQWLTGEGSSDQYIGLHARSYRVHNLPLPLIVLPYTELN